MNFEQLMDSFQHSGYPLDEARKTFLIGLNVANPGVFESLGKYLQMYHTEYGICLHKNIGFILRLFEMESCLPPGLMEYLDGYLKENPILFPDLTEKLYQRLWKEISDQTHSLKLTYHNGFHGLEVTMRTRLGADCLALFTGSDPVSQFLRFILLTAAKYHDCIQWSKTHIRKAGDATTAEEDTAEHLAQVVIEEMGLYLGDQKKNAPLIAFLKFVFPLLIGPGTTVLFAPNTMFNLSQISDELRQVLKLSLKPVQNERLISFLWIATEVLSIADKASFCSQKMMEGEYDMRDTTLDDLLQIKDSLFANFLRSNSSLLYYPEKSFEFNFYVAVVMKISQVEMELELNGTLEEAQRLRDYIREGQCVYRDHPENLQLHLERVFTDPSIYQGFEELYFHHLKIEIGFFKRLPHICNATRARLEKFGGLDAFGLSVYSNDVQDLKTTSEEVISISGPIFVDENVPQKEVELLERLEQQAATWTVEEKQKIVWELLAFSMTQSGIHYTNHPSCIAEMEPPSPQGLRPLISISPVRIPEPNPHRLFREPSMPTLVLPFDEAPTPLARSNEAEKTLIQPK